MSNPIKPKLKTEIISITAVIISAISSFYFYKNFPDKVPTHWNIYGEVDGWGSRGMAAFSIPIIIFAMYIMFLLLPYLDPKKERYEQFSKVYHVFKTVLVVFMTLIYFATSLFALGYNIPVATLIPVMIGFLFVLIGNYMSKLKMNWFVGIKTPWTLSSEEVWNKTHRVGGKLFIFSGVVIAIMSWLPAYLRMPLFMVAILLMTVGTFGYSYFLYSKENKIKKHDNN